jgi:rubrerythrin
MAQEFNANEIYDMAIQIEDNGQLFYNEAVKMAKKSDIKDLFIRLGKWEADHKRTFLQLQDQLSNKEWAKNPFDPNDEAVLFVRSMVKGHIFNMHKDIASLIKKAKNSEDMLKMAIGFEKDTIVYFLGLKEVVPDEDEKNQIDKLVKEEMKHVSILTKELMSMNG